MLASINVFQVLIIINCRTFALLAFLCNIILSLMANLEMMNYSPNNVTNVVNILLLE